MANLSVSGIRERIFNTTKHEQDVARPQGRTTNPFANMNGNLLNADVYVSSNKTSVEKMSFKASIEKLKQAAQVGTLNEIGDKIKGMTESIVSFGRKIQTGITNTWKTLNEYTIEDAVMSLIDTTPSAKYYQKADIGTTREIFKALEAVESERYTG